LTVSIILAVCPSVDYFLVMARSPVFAFKGLGHDLAVEHLIRDWAGSWLWVQVLVGIVVGMLAGLAGQV
jgi:hypothetical protein